MTIPSSALAQRLLLIALGITALVTAVLPWVHNHDYLRDFLDYGLVMSASGRIDAGEKPYVDFITPIQAGFLYINHLAEKMGGGTYRGLTRGNLFLIIFSLGGLWFMLRHRVADSIAITVSWAVVVTSVTQHTIIWYNTLGVICIAAATWSVAVAPALRRQTLSWHIILGLALFIGGLNKISFQAIALVGTFGLIFRASVLQQISIRQLLIGTGFIIGCGLVLPIIFELLFTGATWSEWRYNVLEIATSGRLHHLTVFLGVGAYFTPVHDYYGSLAFPQIGAAIVYLGVTTIIWGWPNRSKLDRALLVTASIGCVAASLALLGTNYEIAYIAFSAAFALFVSLTLAFNFRYLFKATALVLLLPAIIVGLAAWSSAWQGQRTLFGHSGSLRSDYVVLADVAENYSYVDGLHIPPEFANSYAAIQYFMPEPDANGLHPIFYATGLEWLERIWPAVKIPKLPLWLYFGTTYQQTERDMLYQAMLPPSTYDAVLASVPWNHWLDREKIFLNIFSEPQFCGSVILHYPLAKEGISRRDPIHLVNLLGINFEPALWRLEPPYEIELDSKHHVFFGSSKSQATFYFDGIMSRSIAHPVIHRFNPDSLEPVSARFFIDHFNDGAWLPLWSETLTLQPASPELSTSFPFDAHWHRLRFRVELLDSAESVAVAGWRPPTMLDSPPSNEEPPPLLPSPPAVMRDLPDFAAALIKSDWIPDQFVVRNGRLDGDKFSLADRGQLWMRADQGLDSLAGIATLAAPTPLASVKVVVLWFKGGRIQITDQFTLDHEHPSRPFKSWSSGHEGWFGILLQQPADSSLVEIKIEQTQLSD